MRKGKQKQQQQQKSVFKQTIKISILLHKCKHDNDYDDYFIRKN